METKNGIWIVVAIVGVLAVLACSACQVSSNAGTDSTDLARSSGASNRRYERPPLGEPTPKMLSYFDGSETVESLVSEWPETEQKMSEDDVTRHNLIPIRLIYMGEHGLKSVIELPLSKIASSNENLVYYRGRAILQLGVAGVLLACRSGHSQEIASGLYAMQADELANLNLLLDEAVRANSDERAKIEAFRSALPSK